MGLPVKIRKGASEPPTPGSPDLFTGTVRIDYLHKPAAPSRVQVQHVGFEPGARTVWHTHPLGQVLIVIDGLGWVQSEGGPVEEMGPGDVISIAPGEKHWHGASPGSGVTFLAIQEELDGQVVQAMERVSDSEYKKSGTSQGPGSAGR